IRTASPHPESGRRTMLATEHACPSCQTRLKLKPSGAAQRRIRCPKCGTVFSPDEEKSAVRTSSEALNPTITFQGTPPITKAPAKPPVKPVARTRPEPDVDEDEEEDEPPARRKSGAGMVLTAVLVLLLLGIIGAGG